MGKEDSAYLAAQLNPDNPKQRRSGFTLLELLIVLAIVALLIALLLPAMTKARRAGRNLKCVTNLRQVSERFIIFADDFAFESRGNRRGRPTFYLETFQESIYEIDDYWDSASLLPQRIDPADQPLMCPEGPYELMRRANQPCSAGAVFPKENISIAFNRRLHRPTAGSFVKLLSSRILNQPNVPLAMDADGGAPNAPSDPYYAAPPLVGIADGYDTGAHWTPSTRHDGRMNVAFIGGHVGSSREPLTAPGWHWAYIPE